MPLSKQRVETFLVLKGTMAVVLRKPVSDESSRGKKFTARIFNICTPLVSLYCAVFFRDSVDDVKKRRNRTIENWSLLRRYIYSDTVSIRGHTCIEENSWIVKNEILIQKRRRSPDSYSFVKTIFLPVEENPDKIPLELIEAKMPWENPFCTNTSNRKLKYSSRDFETSNSIFWASRDISGPFLGIGAYNI